MLRGELRPDVPYYGTVKSADKRFILQGSLKDDYAGKGAGTHHPGNHLTNYRSKLRIYAFSEGLVLLKASLKVCF